MPEFLSDPATRDNADTRDLYQDPVAWHGRIATAYAQSARGWQQADWSALDGYGWRNLTGHLAAGGKTLRPQLYEVYSAGFLAAKRKASASPSELELDWRLILRACREAQDLAAFLRFGYQISQQASELSFLQVGRVAQTVVDLALRRKDRLAIERIAAEFALLDHPPARLSAQQSLLEKILGDREYAATAEQLIANIAAVLPAFEPGQERDEAVARQIRLLSKAGWADWENDAAEALISTKVLHCRNLIYAALSGGAARSGQIEAAARWFSIGIDECRRFELQDNLVGDILQMVMAVERVEPAAELAGALDLLLPAIADFGSGTDDSLRTLTESAREQFARIERSDLRLQLEAKLFHYLLDGGHRDLAVEMVRPTLEDQIGKSALPAEPAQDSGIAAQDFGTSMMESARASGVIIDLLSLLSPAGVVDNGSRLPEIERLLLDQVRRISQFDSLMNAAQYASAIPTFDPQVKNITATFLNVIEARARDITGGEGLFAMLAILSPAYVRIGEQSRATAIVQEILDNMPPVWPEPAVYPEQARALSAGFETVWVAACSIGDEPLIEAVLNWLTSAVPSVLDFERVGEIWRRASGAVEEIADAGVAQRMLDRLRPRLLETRDVDRFEATASIQIADAYANLGTREESLRLLNSPPVRKVARWASLAGWTASLLARQGDLEGCRNLLASALETVPPTSGLNIQADMLISLTKGLHNLANTGPQGAGEAKRLSCRFLEISEEIDHGEYSLLSQSAIIQELATGGVAMPTRELASSARRYFGEGKALGTVGTVLHAIAVLHQAAEHTEPDPWWSKFVPFYHPTHPADMERELTAKVEDLLARTEPNSDVERSQFCAVCARMAAMNQFVGRAGTPPPWRDRAAAMASAISAPDNYVDACCAMARIDAAQRPGEALRWVEQATEAYEAVQEVYEINSAAQRIMSVWEALPDANLRSRCKEAVSRVLWRICDPDLKSDLHARLTIGLWHEPETFAEMFSRLEPGHGNSTILMALDREDMLPPHIGPDVLFGCLEKSARLSRVTFAGDSLTAAQAIVKRGWLDRSVQVAALQSVENMMREISPSGLGTKPPPRPAQTSATGKR